MRNVENIDQYIVMSLTSQIKTGGLSQRSNQASIFTDELQAFNMASELLRN